MVIVEDLSNNYDAFTLRALSSEYIRLLQNTQIFSKLHRMWKVQYNDPNM
jgi:hypothetical protein